MIIATSTPKKWKPFAELIKWYQKTDFSHVLIIDDELVYQASHSSVNVFHIDIFLADNKIVRVYDVEDTLVDISYVKRQLGKPYGVGQVFSLALYVFTGIKLKGNGDKKFICSELIGRALRLEWVNDMTTPKQIDEYLKTISR